MDDLDVAKDIVHNVFLNLWNKREEVDWSAPIKPYLFKAVHNRCLNQLRDSKRIVRHELDIEPEAIPDYVESRDFLEESELEKRIANAIDSLPEKCRRIFRLSRFEGKKYSEIAETEGISVKTVEDQMSKALRILRDNLKDYLTIYIFLYFFQGLSSYMCDYL